MNVPKPKKTASGLYRIQLRLGGVSYPVTGVTSLDCKKAAEKLKADWRSGALVSAPQGITLSEACARYIASRENTLSPSTISGYRYIASHYFQSAMGRPLASLNWQKLINDEAKRYSGKTVKNAWGFMSSVLKYNRSPVPDVTLPQVIKRPRPWLDPDEIKTFVLAAKGTPGEIGALIALHSLRRSEMLALTWDKIDLDKGVIYVEGATVRGENGLVDKETNKNSSSRRAVPIMIPELAAALKAVPDKTGKVVNVSEDVTRRRINKICEKAGLPKVGVHGMRYSFASLAYHLGVPERECMILGGWDDPTVMHNIYIRISEKDIKKYASEMANFYKE